MDNARSRASRRKWWQTSQPWTYTSPSRALLIAKDAPPCECVSQPTAMLLWPWWNIWPCCGSGRIVVVSTAIEAAPRPATTIKTVVTYYSCQRIVIVIAIVIAIVLPLSSSSSLSSYCHCYFVLSLSLSVVRIAPSPWIAQRAPH